MDAADSSSQQGASCSSVSQEATPMEGVCPSEDLHCRWKDCSEVSEDKPAFYYHLLNHADENMPGPCQWRQCKVAEGAVNSRKMRHQPRFMANHIKIHLPKSGFKCIMEGCHRAFDTPEQLSNHISKHPQQPKKEKLDYRLEDPSNGRIREIPVDTMNVAGGMAQLQKSLKVHDMLRLIGILYVPLVNEYFITVHGQPEGEVVVKPGGREQNYRLRFPYAPAWMKEMYIRCMLEESESKYAIITWKLPLSNPVFRDPLRIFIKQVEVQFVQQDV